MSVLESVQGLHENIEFIFDEHGCDYIFKQFNFGIIFATKASKVQIKESCDSMHEVLFKVFDLVYNFLNLCWHFFKSVYFLCLIPSRVTVVVNQVHQQSVLVNELKNKFLYYYVYRVTCCFYQVFYNPKLRQEIFILQQQKVLSRYYFYFFKLHFRRGPSFVVLFWVFYWFLQFCASSFWVLLKLTVELLLPVLFQRYFLFTKNP